uniref:Beta-galactosidase n=1 Tax=Populus davidiana TaxID=266767 RepID=A0A6M2ELT5_9ROSI
MMISSRLQISFIQFLSFHLIIQFTLISSNFFEPFNVTYDHRALIIDGRRRMLNSAGIHYPRATPEMWPDLIAKSKEGGADVVQTYVFWGGHEPVKGQYYFEGRYDLVKFVKLVGESGLYLHLRIGPYVCAEWNFGGFPVWLRDVPGVVFRTDNAPFKEEMQKFVTKIVDLMREEMLLSWQGGPIIMFQIENEYGNIEHSFGQGGKEYMKWAAGMALALDTRVPWVMCKQTDAPENIIDACNAYYCDGFKPNSPKKPIFWTEDWDGWYTTWGGRLPHRPVEDLAFAVARFFQRGGSFQNYYMYFGGTNFGRTSGGPFYITSYDYDAPIDEYGLLSEPKWGHLKDLHAAIKLCEPALVAADSAQYIKLGPKQEAHVYGGSLSIQGMNFSQYGSQSLCSAFLANIDEHKAATVRFLGQSFTLPPWSVSILPDCRNTVFNTAKVAAQTHIKTVEFVLPLSNSSLLPQFIVQNEDSPQSTSWLTAKEPITLWSEENFTVKGILEHLNVTKDESDYLWYFTRIYVSDDDIAFWEKNKVNPAVSIDSMRDVLRVFINGQLTGSVVGHWVKAVQPVQFHKGYNELVLLSQTVGLQNYGAFLERDGAGFKGQIKLTGFKNGDIDLSNLSWTYQVGLKGEFLEVYSTGDNEKFEWSDLAVDATPSTFTWYKTFFDAPSGVDPVALDLGSMGKGQAWVNGHHIGRYWTLVSPKDGCGSCDYRGAYSSGKCRTNCGNPTQTWYHVPRAWLEASNNLLVVFEETGGNPFEISVKLRSAKVICGQVSESHYPPLRKWSRADLTGGNVSRNDMTPEMHLKCQNGHIMSSIEFASYGTPNGSCQKFSRGNCHASNSSSVVTEACQGKNKCDIAISNAVFGDPCRGVIKTLAVEARCISSSNIGYSLY